MRALAAARRFAFRRAGIFYAPFSAPVRACTSVRVCVCVCVCVCEGCPINGFYEGYSESRGKRSLERAVFFYLFL